MEIFALPGNRSGISRSRTVESSQNYSRGHTPSAPQPQQRIFRNRALTLLPSSVLAGTIPFPPHALAETILIVIPAGASQTMGTILRLDRLDALFTSRTRCLNYAPPG